ncbi:MAG: hypothetical protein IJB79_04815 [Candidatus Gastranaerophilales bacterium]|nr:hypothetical protein [Candidatus Gastranaerophilales bacterium]
MSNYNKKKNKNEDLDFLEVFKAVALILFGIGFLWFLKWVYFDIYKPEEKKYIKNSMYAYEILQEELTKFYREKGFVFEDVNQKQDEFCELVRQKYSPDYGSCNVGHFVSTNPNIIFKNRGIFIYGFEKPPIQSDGTIVKDLIIDVNGEKGENTLGVDRVGIRIYSTGRMGGMISPINCKREDEEDYGIPYSPACTAGFNMNFMDMKIPFGYDVTQIGGKKGKSRRLGQNITFLRADCIAFGGEIVGATEFCDKRGYHWLTACYHEYFCSMQLHKK